MDALSHARKEIDQIDGEMALLFERRMHAVEAVAKFKATHGLPVLDEAREHAVLRQNSDRVQDERIRAYYDDFMRTVMDLSKKFQFALLSEK